MSPIIYGEEVRADTSTTPAAYRETPDDVPRSAALAIVAAALGSLILGIVLQVTGGPWVLWIPLWWVSSTLIWRFVAKRGFRDLMRAPRGTQLNDLMIGFGLTALGGMAMLAVSSAYGRLVAPASLEGSRVLHALLMAVVVSILLNAVPEELTVRGILLRLVGSQLPGAAAVVLLGVYFGLAHLPTLLSGTMGETNLLLAVVSRAVWGTFVGWAAWRLQSIWFAIGWHAGGNAVSTGLDTLGFEGLLYGVAPGWGEVVDPLVMIGIPVVLMLSRRRHAYPRPTSSGRIT